MYAIIRDRGMQYRVEAGQILEIALIEAERFLRDPANHAKVAQHAAPTGRTGQIAINALKDYIAMEFWPKGHDGLGRKNIETVGKIMVKVGNIKGGKGPAPYERIVDQSVWKDANAMVK